jgi:hypothetical protein
MRAQFFMPARTAFAGFLLFLSLASAGWAQQVAATGRGIRQPAVAALGTGDFVVAWSDIDDGASSFGVFARLFGGSGTPKGPAFLVNGDIAGDEVQPKVAADEHGNFVVVWQGGLRVRGTRAWPGGDGDGLGVFAQRFDRTGRKQGPALRLSRSPAGDQITPGVAMNADGAFVAVWQDCPRTNDCPRLRVSRFTASGQRRGQEQEIPVLRGVGFGGTVPNPPPFVAVEPGGYAVGWTEQEACYKWYFERFPVVVHFTDAGRPVGERFRLDDGDCEDATGWLLTALTTSRTGTSAAFFNGLRNSFQLFGPDGDPEGERTVVGQRNPCTPNRCETIGGAAMDAEGDFAVVWNYQTGTGNEGDPVRYSLVAQFFAGTGHPLGERFELAASAHLLSSPSVAFGRDGSLITAWVDLLPDLSGYRLLVREVRGRT